MGVLNNPVATLLSGLCGVQHNATLVPASQTWTFLGHLFLHRVYARQSAYPCALCAATLE